MSHKKSIKPVFLLRPPLYCVLAAYACITANALAATGSQNSGITVDGTLSPARSLSGPNYLISADLGRQLGGNLFHSFGAFNLANGESATFSGPGSISNVIGRVTGGSASSIDGTLRCSIPGANLYLINPNGLMFGPHAALDIDGSFYASSASYLRFADGVRFDASAPANSILTSAPPAAFGFLSASPATVMVQGASLQLNQGKELALVGGNIEMTDGATLSAPAGRILLGSIGGSGEISGTGNIVTGGNILLRGSSLDVSADSGGGAIVIRGGKLQLDGSHAMATTVSGTGGSIDIGVGQDITLTSGANISTNTRGAGTGGDILLSAGDAITLSGRGVDGGYTAVHASTTAAGDAGHIRLTAPHITIDNGLVQSLTIGETGGPAQYGNGGAISVQATNLTLRNGGQLDSGSRSGSNGNGGSIDISADASVKVSGVGTDGYASVIFASLEGDGLGGHIAVRAPEVLIENGAKLSASTSGAGKGGFVEIQAGRLSLSGGAEIRANTSGTGAGGNVDIAATDSISVIGTGSNGDFSAILANTSGSGSGGQVKLVAPRVSVDGGLVQALSTGSGNAGGISLQVTGLVISNGGQISSSSRGAHGGNGGNIDIVASEAVRISGADSEGTPSGIFANTGGDGNGGGIFLRGPLVSLADGGTVQANATGIGNGGAVRMEGRRVELAGGGVISTNSSGIGKGGSVDVSATDAISIVGQGPSGTYSAIRANASGAGNGGSLHLSTDSLLLDSGLLQARTNGNRAPGGRNGDAGNISVQAGDVSLLNGGQIDSGSRGDSNGNGGNVDISASRSILFSGADAAGFHSGIFANTLGDGHGGYVNLAAPHIALDKSAGITVAASGAGAGGNVRIQANRLDLADASNIKANTSGAGAGGNILLQTTTTSVKGGSTIQATAASTGGGGSVRIETGRLTVDGGAEVSTNTSGAGNGGSVDVFATDTIGVTGHDADGYSSAIRSNTNGAGKGGYVHLATGSLVIDSGLVQALTFGERVATGQNGDAGNISIQAANVSLLSGGQIDSGSRGNSNGRGGNIDLRAGETLALSGEDSAILANTQGSGDGGSVYLNAAQVALDGGARIQAMTSGSGAGGTIKLASTDLSLAGGSYISANTSGSGAGGYIDVSAARSITLTGSVTSDLSSSIVASTFGGGNGGNIFVTAPSITLDLGLIQALSTGYLANGAKNGKGGDITIKVGELKLLNGGQIDSSSRDASSGDGGNVLISASDAISVSGVGPRYPSAIFANTFGSGAGGSIYLDTPRLAVGNNATVQATTSSSGSGGIVGIDAGRVDVDSGGTISAATYGSGNGGYVMVVASDAVTVSGRASDGGLSAISATTAGGGDGGFVLVRTPSMKLNDGEISTGSSGMGAGGLIGIQAEREIALENGARISSTSTGSGNAGNILLETRAFSSNRGAVTTEAAYAGGGNIYIDATTARLNNQSTITATVGGGFGDGGNVTLSARGIGAVENSDITARADQGHGGRITINAEAFLRGKDVNLDASSNVVGNEGVVAVNAPRLDISASLVVLSSDFLDASALLNDPCASSRAGQASTFVIRGRGGMPMPPDSPLPSALSTPPSAGTATRQRVGGVARGGLDCRQFAPIRKEERI